MMWWQLDGVGGGIQDPPQHDLPSGPGRITFQQFFDGSRFLDEQAIGAA
jgi:hypothetical protein